MSYYFLWYSLFLLMNLWLDGQDTLQSSGRKAWDDCKLSVFSQTWPYVKSSEGLKLERKKHCSVEHTYTHENTFKNNTSQHFLDLSHRFQAPAYWIWVSVAQKARKFSDNLARSSTIFWILCQPCPQWHLLVYYWWILFPASHPKDLLY